MGCQGLKPVAIDPGPVGAIGVAGREAGRGGIGDSTGQKAGRNSSAGICATG